MLGGAGVGSEATNGGAYKCSGVPGSGAKRLTAARINARGCRGRARSDQRQRIKLDPGSSPGLPLFVYRCQTQHQTTHRPALDAGPKQQHDHQAARKRMSPSPSWGGIKGGGRFTSPQSPTIAKRDPGSSPGMPRTENEQTHTGVEFEMLS
ncbi:MAG: hypothetical protein ACJAZW_002905 [Maritalea sp.]|jgi:hypothetical protein